MSTSKIFQSRNCLGVKRTRGFTLLEVMLVVGVLGVLATLVAPSFTRIIEKWRVQQTVEIMKSTLYFARSEAIKRGGLYAVLCGT